MTVEEARIHLRTQLEEQFGVMEASRLLDRPPGGWSDLATKRDVDALEGRIDRRFDELTAKVDDVSRIVKLEMDRAISQAFTSQLRWTIASMIGLLAVVVGALKF